MKSLLSKPLLHFKSPRKSPVPCKESLNKVRFTQDNASEVSRPQSSHTLNVKCWAENPAGLCLGFWPVELWGDKCMWFQVVCLLCSSEKLIQSYSLNHSVNFYRINLDHIFLRLFNWSLDSWFFLSKQRILIALDEWIWPLELWPKFLRSPWREVEV